MRCHLFIFRDVSHNENNNEVVDETSITGNTALCVNDSFLKTSYTPKKIAEKIASDDYLFNELCKTKRLPIKQLEKLFPIHRKKIERGRIYIIALVIAIKIKLSFLQV